MSGQEWDTTKTGIRRNPTCSKGARPVKTKTRVRAGALSLNHNETLVADRPRKLCRR